MPAKEQPSHLHKEHHAPILREHIPQELLLYPQWVCWRYVDRGENKKPDKQPVNPHTLNNAGVHWANTWSTFEHAYMTHLMYQERGLCGVGFVLTSGDPFVGVDIDDCVDKGEISPHARDAIGHLQSYTEVSPSGHGLRILVACSNFTENARAESLEVYSHSRFLTLTGHHVEGTPTTITTVVRDRIVAMLPHPEEEKEAAPAHQTQAHAYDTPDLDLWQRIFDHDKFGAQHLQRFQGDISLDRGDHSLTVIRLLNTLARWTGEDAARMRSMMLLSPLANEKWFSKRGSGDWLDHQIKDAINYIIRNK